MEHGDIDNRVAPRGLYVFEGYIANLTPAAAARRKLLLRAHQWKRAAVCWQFDEHTVKVIWDVTWRRNLTVDIFTYVDDREADYIEDRLDDMGIPYGNLIVIHDEAEMRAVVNNPSVVVVTDPDPRRSGRYGSKWVE